MESAFIVDSPELITAEICNEWLIESHNMTGATVKRIQVHPLDCVSGYLSSMWEVCIEYDRVSCALPQRLVVKAESSTQDNRERSKRFNAFDHEVRFYNEIAPECPIALPRCYCTACNTAGDSMIVMEDLSELKFGDQVCGLDALESARCIDVIGTFHSRWWNRTDELAPGFPEHTYMSVSAFDEYWNYFRRQNHSALTKEQLRQGDALFGHVDEVLSIASQSPATLVHADLRADNLRINSMRGTVYILDWQLLCRGLGAFDVARLLGGSLKEDLDEVGHEILCRRWHHALRQNSVKNYSISQVRHDYKLAMLMCVHIPVTNYCLLSSLGGRTEQLIGCMIHRFFNAAACIDAASILD